MTDLPLWVFGYGSLVWNPGFAYEERAVATLPRFARTFCMRSIHHRGTPEDPGLVLALDASDDHDCHGVGFRIHKDAQIDTMTYLRERELVSSAYLEEVHPIRLSTGETLDAVTYVVDRHHVQYCGGLPLEEQAHIIAHAVGGRGPNTEYLYNTAAHLSELGLEDEDLTWLVGRVRDITSAKG